MKLYSDEESLEGVVSQMNKRDYDLRPQKEQQLFKNIAETMMKNEFTIEEFCECVQNLLANDVEILISFFPAKLQPKIDKVMVNFYTNNFKNYVDGKPDSTPIVSFDKYKKDIAKNKISRFITIYEMFCVVEGLKSSPNVLLFNKPQPDNKYVLKLKQIYDSRKPVVERNKEYALRQKVSKQLLTDCFEKVNKLVANKTDNIGL